MTEDTRKFFLDYINLTAKTTASAMTEPLREDISKLDRQVAALSAGLPGQIAKAIHHCARSRTAYRWKVFGAVIASAGVLSGIVAIIMKGF